MKYLYFCAAAVLVVPAYGGLINFDSDNGGFTATIAIDAAGVGGWQYQAANTATCAGGTGGCWFTPDGNNVGDFRLTSPIFVASGLTALSFDHAFPMETGFDGGVVEISINGGAFTDVGPFTSGQDYNGTISGSFGNPLANRNAFTGGSGYVTSGTTLALSNGDQFQVRWREGTDSSVSAVGWLLDNVNIDAPLFGAASVPEPSSIGLALLGLSAFAYRLRRRQ